MVDRRNILHTDRRRFCKENLYIQIITIRNFRSVSSVFWSRCCLFVVVFVVVVFFCCCCLFLFFGGGGVSLSDF